MIIEFSVGKESGMWDVGSFYVIMWFEGKIVICEVVSYFKC